MKKLLQIFETIPSNRTVIFASLLALFILICLPLLESISSISNGILAITAIIILWYTHETSMMRQEVTRQNILLTRPAVVIELLDRKVFLKNDGKGPALNIQSELSVKAIFEKEDACKQDIHSLFYEIPTIPYMAQDSKEELKLFKKNISDGTQGTISEPDEFFQIGKSVTLIVRYNDIEGTKYKTKVEIQSGNLKDISFQKISH